MSLDDKLNDFIARTGKSKVAVIVPLYGYWKDINDNPLNLQTLQLSIDRITSSVHNLYIFFVAESARTPVDIANYIVTHSQAGGNFYGVKVDDGSSYADYVRKGVEVAMDTTESAYFIVLNPWNLIQRIGIDAMVDRINYSDEVKLVSGYDLRGEITTDEFDPKDFEIKCFNIPQEKQRVDSNFMGIARYALEMTPLDQNIKTAYYLERDMFQNLHTKGYNAVATQLVPMFVFDVNIDSIENPTDLESDRAYFVSKWGFNPEE